MSLQVKYLYWRWITSLWRSVHSRIRRMRFDVYIGCNFAARWFWWNQLSLLYEIDKIVILSWIRSATGRVYTPDSAIAFTLEPTITRRCNWTSLETVGRRHVQCAYLPRWHSLWPSMRSVIRG